MAWEEVEGVGLPVGEEVEGVELPVGGEVEGVGLPVGGGAGGWLSPSIFSFNLSMCASYAFLFHSCLLRSSVTFCDVLSMFILSKREKINKKWVATLSLINNHLSLPLKQK